MKTRTGVECCYKTRERSRDTSSTRPESVDSENSMRRPHIGKWPKKKCGNGDSCRVRAEVVVIHA